MGGHPGLRLCWLCLKLGFALASAAHAAATIAAAAHAAAAHSAAARSATAHAAAAVTVAIRATCARVHGARDGKAVRQLQDTLRPRYAL